MTKKHFPKLFLSFVMIALTCLMLTGCSNGSRVPMEGINVDEVYLSNNTVTVTTGDLYKSLKTRYGLDILNKAINKVVFKEQIEKYNADPENTTYRKYLEYFVDTDCYNNSDKEVIAEYELDTKLKAQQMFLDNLMTYGVDIDYAKNAEGEYDIYQASIAQYYIVDIAVAIYSYEMVVDEWNGLVAIEDEIEILYTEDEITESIREEIEKSQTDKIVDYYSSNYDRQGNQLGILIKFNDSNEYDDTLKLLRLKTVGGKWYQIPYNADAEFGTTAFDNYYSNYTITTETALTDAEIFAYFIIMFNFVNSYRSSIVYDMGWSSSDDIETVTVNISNDTAEGKAVVDAIVSACADEDGNIKFGSVDETDGSYTPSEFITSLLEKDVNGDFVLEYDEYYDSYFTIFNHFYTTLKTTGQKFSTKGMTYTNSITGSDATFLGFKLAENEKIVLYNEITNTETDEDGEETETTEYEFVNDELKQEIIDRIISDNVESIIANDYSLLLNAKYELDEIYSDKKLKIYDTDLQLLYSLDYTDYKKTSATSGAVIATINGVDITAKDFADELISSYGPIVSLSLAFDKYLVYLYENGYFEGQIVGTEFEQTLKSSYTYYMNLFANGQDQISGLSLPASIGKKAYMQIAFGASTMNEAMEGYIKPTLLKSLYYSNLDKFYSDAELDPYAIIAEYAKAEFDKYYSITYTNLLVYIDMNGDEELENPDDYIATLSEDEAAEFKTLICDLMDEATKRINEARSLETGVSEFATEYNKASRFDDRWGKFKKAGLFVKYESAATCVNGSVSSSALVTEFADRLEEIYNDLSNWESTEEPYYIDTTFIPLLDHEIGKSYDNLLKTQFGYHLIYLSDAANKPDATFSSTSDKYTNITYKYKNSNSETYNEVIVENVNNDNPYPNANQVEVYFRDYELYSETIHNMTTDLATNLKSTLETIYTRYTSSTHRTLLIIKVLNDAGFNFASADNAILADEITRISVLQLDSYEDTIYNNWFDDFGFNTSFFDFD